MAYDWKKRYNPFAAKEKEPDSWYIAWNFKSKKGDYFLSCVYGKLDGSALYEWKSWEHTPSEKELK